jgi:hypothetical protein
LPDKSGTFVALKQFSRAILPAAVAFGLFTLPSFGQIGGSGWSPAPVTFNVQWPYNVAQNTRYWFTNNIYHCLVYSNDVPFKVGSTTLPRTEQRFTPDYTSGEIQYQATLKAEPTENSYCVFQIHTGDAQSPTFGSTTFMLFWFTNNGGSVRDYSGTELARNLGNQWFQLNVDHNLVTGSIKVWINQKLVWTQQDNGAGDFYMKDGVYEQNHGPTLQMDTYITNILMWTSSGTNPPGAPTGLTATPTNGQIVLKWNASVDAASYNVKRSTSSGGPYTTLVSDPTNNFVDGGVANGPTYYYVISAVDQFGESVNSSQVSATLADPGYQLSATPASATVLTGNGTNFTVTMTTNVSYSGVTTFGISGLPGSASASFSPQTLSVAGTTTLSVQTSSNAPPGNYPLTIYGTNGAHQVTTTATLSVSTITASPGILVWTNASGPNTNWSAVANWVNITAGGLGLPGINNSVLFTNFGATNASALSAPGSGVVVPANLTSFANGNFTIGPMTNLANAVNASPIYQNIGIASGATLSVNGNLQAGGFTTYLFGDNNVANLSVSGSGASLQVASGGVTVSEDAANGPGNNAMLDLSGLDTFTMNGTQIRLGVEGSGSFHHASGVAYLAKTNALTFTSAGYTDTSGSGSPSSGNPGLYLGHNTSAFGTGSRLYLGINNNLFMDYATVGRGDINAVFAFNPAFLSLNPSVTIRGLSGGSSRVGVYVVGDGSAGAQANNAPSTNDFSGGTVDAMLNYLCVGRGRSGNTSSVGGSGVLTYDAGSINVNTLVAGFIYPNGSNSPAIGTVNVNGAATLTVNSNLVLAQAANVAGQTAYPQGTLNINGGTVQTTNVIGLGGVSTINLNSGLLDLQFGHPSPGQLGGISTLNVGAVGIGDPAQLANAASITVSNPVVIAANGTLAGNTVMTSPGLTVNGSLSPGTSGVGSMTNNGPLTLGAGGEMVITVQDATAGPGVGWSFLSEAGGLNILASAGNPFTFTLQTIGLAANFDSHSNYDWVVATASGGIANFDPTLFAVDDSLFGNALRNGFFYVRTNNNSLIVSFTNPPTAVVFNSIAVSGASRSDLVFSGTGGSPMAPYYLRSSTNLLLPLGQWQTVATSQFDAAGNFSLTVAGAVDPAVARRFYRIQTQ